MGQEGAPPREGACNSIHLLLLLLHKGSTQYRNVIKVVIAHVGIDKAEYDKIIRFVWDRCPAPIR